MDPITIYEDLKEKIIWLELAPGSTLNLVELAESYGVSRNHIKSALLAIRKTTVQKNSPGLIGYRSKQFGTVLKIRKLLNKLFRWRH